MNNESCLIMVSEVEYGAPRILESKEFMGGPKPCHAGRQIPLSLHHRRVPPIRAIAGSFPRGF